MEDDFVDFLGYTRPALRKHFENKMFRNPRKELLKAAEIDYFVPGYLDYRAALAAEEAYKKNRYWWINTSKDKEAARKVYENDNFYLENNSDDVAPAINTLKDAILAKYKSKINRAGWTPELEDSYLLELNDIDRGVAMSLALPALTLASIYGGPILWQKAKGFTKDLASLPKDLMTDKVLRRTFTRGLLDMGGGMALNNAYTSFTGSSFESQLSNATHGYIPEYLGTFLNPFFMGPGMAMRWLDSRNPMKFQQTLFESRMKPKAPKSSLQNLLLLGILSEPIDKISGKVKETTSEYFDKNLNHPHRFPVKQRQIDKVHQQATDLLDKYGFTD